MAPGSFYQNTTIIRYVTPELESGNRMGWCRRRHAVYTFILLFVVVQVTVFLVVTSIYSSTDGDGLTVRGSTSASTSQSAPSPKPLKSDGFAELLAAPPLLLHRAPNAVLAVVDSAFVADRVTMVVDSHRLVNEVDSIASNRAKTQALAAKGAKYDAVLWAVELAESKEKLEVEIGEISTTTKSLLAEGGFVSIHTQCNTPLGAVYSNLKRTFSRAWVYYHSDPASPGLHECFVLATACQNVMDPRNLSPALIDERILTQFRPHSLTHVDGTAFLGAFSTPRSVRNLMFSGGDKDSKSPIDRNLRGEQREVVEATSGGVVGVHHVVEAYGVQQVNNATYLESALQSAALDGGATVLANVSYEFGVGMGKENAADGVTMLILLSESHISLHTWPEYNYAALDVFTCGDKAKTEFIVDRILGALNAQEWVKCTLPRGLRSVGVGSAPSAVTQHVWTQPPTRQDAATAIVPQEGPRRVSTVWDQWASDRDRENRVMAIMPLKKALCDYFPIAYSAQQIFDRIHVLSQSSAMIAMPPASGVKTDSVGPIEGQPTAKLSGMLASSKAVQVARTLCPKVSQQGARVCDGSSQFCLSPTTVECVSPLCNDGNWT